MYQDPQQNGNGNPLSGIIGAALNILPFVVPEIGIPTRIALGAASTAAANGIEGKPQSIGQDLMGGVSDGLMSGVLGGAGKAAKGAGALEGVAKDDALGAADSGLAAPEGSQSSPYDVSTDSPTEAQPTIATPDTPQGHVDFQQTADGNVSTVPAVQTAEQPESNTTNPVTPVANPAQSAAPAPERVPQTSETDTFTQTNPQAVQNNLNLGQKVGQDIAIPALEQQIRQGGSRMTTQEVQQLARLLHGNDYASLNDAASDGNLITGNQGILSNAVRDHINNADANGAVVDLGDYNKLIQNHINDALSSGVLAPGQLKVMQNTPNDIKNLIGGNAGDRDITGELTLEQARNTPVGNAFKTVQTLQGLAAKQGEIAQGRGAKSEGAKVLQGFYNNLANDIQDRAFGVANGASPISDENIDNMVTQLKGAPFKNATQQESLINRLENSKGGKLSVQDVRSLQAPSVKAMIAASPDQISNLTNGLMTAGLSKTGAINAALNSNPGLVARAAAGNKIYKISSPGGSVLSGASLSGGTGKMNPLGKIALLGGAGVLGSGALNAIINANQGSQASQELDNPEYQKTQSILNNANAQQRYLGEIGQIRSILAPTFDTNAGQAGQTGALMLQKANQNAQAQEAVQNLLQARSQMGQGGVLGSILSVIPGTPENAYKQAAANAQAQLNALGIAGNAPGVASSNAVMPSLTSAASNVGAF